MLLLSSNESASLSLTHTTANHPQPSECEQEPCTQSVEDRLATRSIGSVPTDAGQVVAMVSRSSTASFTPNFGSTDVSGSICRICHEGSADEALLSPCHCSGSVKHVHQTCLQQWLQAGASESCGGSAGRPGTSTASDTRRHCDRCELCGYNFIMTSRVKPFRKWKKLKMTSVERRKVLCSVTFHAVAITCVVWSLYVLIDRTTQEIQEGNLQWPFWTKLVVVAIGFTGGLVFMYVQCKMYVQLFRKWRAYNRIIQIQSFVGNTTAEKSTLDGVPALQLKPLPPPAAGVAVLLHDSQQLPV